jgi:hypothetical protein
MAVFDLIDTHDIRWGLALSAADADVYSTPAYVEIAARAEDAEPYAFWWRDDTVELLVPLLLRDIGNGPLRDAASPYGYPGIVCSGCEPDALPQRFFLDLKETLRKSGIVSLFLRLHPILNQHMVWPTELGVCGGGPTVRINLDDMEFDGNGIPACFEKSHKWGVRKLRKEGFTSHRVCLSDSDSLAAFGNLYSQTMQRVEAHSFYHFDQAYFHGIRDKLGSLATLGLVRTKDGTIASGGLFFEYQGKVNFHLAGSSEGYAKIAPNKLLVADICSYFKGRGAHWLHMGGGVGGAQDSLFTYKKRFSPERGEFKTVKYIVNESAYSELLGVALSEACYEGYFPAYRACAKGLEEKKQNVFPLEIRGQEQHRVC